jgi:hypothetical protein
MVDEVWASRDPQAKNAAMPTAADINPFNNFVITVKSQSI